MGKSYKVINKEKGIGISYIPKKPNGVANIMYNSCGSSLSENYKNLGEEEKENRINLIIDEILKDSKKKGVDLKKVFIIKDGFDALTKKEKGLLDDGIEYKIKYKKFSKDGIDYYAVRHPVGSPHISYEK